MRGLTELERRALQPVGPPGEHCPNHVFDALIRDGRGRWVELDGGSWFEPTELGWIALRCCPPPK